VTAWARLAAAAAPFWYRFARSLAEPEQAQSDLLHRMLRRSESSSFGEHYGFAGIRSVDAFRERVPVRAYEDFRPSIERIAAGEPNVLSGGKLVAFEQTGGSSGGMKLIPRTGWGLEAFTAAVLPWLHDMLQVRPGIAAGSAYLAISPATRAPHMTPSGVPIGVAADAAYFGEGLAETVSALSAVPKSAALIRDAREWAVFTLAHLVAAADLSFVSVWSPSFLSQLLLTLESRGEEVCQMLEHGLGGPRALSRAALLRRLLAARPLDTATLWPLLDTVSAWSEAGSRPFAAALQRELPHAYLQGKGLLATEGVVTIPVCRAAHPIPALASTFLEFIDDGGASRLAHELEDGEAYRVVMTTWDGLYRYDIGDRVRCCGFLEGKLGDAAIRRGTVPLLAFAGRADRSSDLVGEKLTDDFVTTCLGDREGFAVLFPVLGPPARYGLLVEGGDDGAGFCHAVEQALRGNPQYAYARDIGQLAPVKLMRAEHALARYTAWALSQGGRLAEIKPPRLLPDPTLAATIWPEEGQT
jgi:hypothetical protein